MKYLTLDGLTHYHSRLDNRQRLRDLAIFGTSNFYVLNELYNNGEPYDYEGDLYLEHLMQLENDNPQLPQGALIFMTASNGEDSVIMILAKTDDDTADVDDPDSFKFRYYVLADGGTENILLKLRDIYKQIDGLTPTKFHRKIIELYNTDGLGEDHYIIDTLPPNYDYRSYPLVYLPSTNQLYLAATGSRWGLYEMWDNAGHMGDVVKTSAGKQITRPRRDVLYLLDGVFHQYDGKTLVALNPAPEALTESEILDALNGII